MKFILFCITSDSQIQSLQKNDINEEMLNPISQVSPSENLTIENSMSTSKNLNSNPNKADISFINNKTDIKSQINFFVKPQRKSDHNLNILDSELVTFRKNFHHHIPKRRSIKTMESGNYPQQKNNGFPPKLSTSLQSSNSQINYLMSDKTKDKDNDRYVWEMWMRTSNTTPASTVLNSPDLTDMEQSNNFQNQIQVGRSPVSGQNEERSPDDSHTFVNEGEVVVFSDIEENWKSENTPASTLTEQQNKYSDYENINHDNEATGISSSTLTKMIGALPINDYEGSPRRFGNIHHTENLTNQQASQRGNGVDLPRPPGFPKRVMQFNAQDNLGSDQVVNMIIDSDKQHVAAGQSSNRKEVAFDYLYEFSETRKVLEEFFKSPNEDNKKINEYNESDAECFVVCHELRPICFF